MAKHIVVCSDGTGNSAVKGRGTNVFKVFEAIDLNGHRTDPTLVPQVAIYDDGVGTERFKPLKIFAGMTGFGLSRNVKQLYKELCRIYDPGDKIFLFGFSRGAFTVRALAGLIATGGIVNARDQQTASALESAVRRAYKAYRRRYRTALARFLLGEPDSETTARFKIEYRHGADAKIAFIGVWDTVDAVGLPFHLSDVVNTVLYRFKFPDRRLSDRVERAYHALAIDDERHSFHPLLWDQTTHGQNQDQHIEQVWFAGAHSNVGGGYPKQGMSLVALDWLMQKAEEAGLRFVVADREFYREHANVDDKLYDPRAGLGMFYRFKPRDLSAMCRENGVSPAIHLSVLERIAHGTDDYCPGNLPPDATVVITPAGDPGKEAAAMERAREVEAVLRSAHADGKPLLARVGAAVVMGRASYYVYLLSCAAVLIAASAPPGAQSGLNPWRWLRSGALLVANLVTEPLGTVASIITGLAANPTLAGGLAAGFLAAYLLEVVADRRMSAVCSQFWHEAQQQLRDALKRARKAAGARVTESTAAWRESRARSTTLPPRQVA